MESGHEHRIRAHLRPLAPLPTNVEVRLASLTDVRGVLFDVYGTMLVSGCGEIGTEATGNRVEALTAACQAVALTPPLAPAELLEQFDREIARQHGEKRGQGIPYPEVDIREVWRNVLQGANVTDLSAGRLEDLALEYELRINPVWPMPGLEVCLETVRNRGAWLGIISNAQFFTPLLFPPLLGRSVEGLGFDPELQFYSYRYGRAKPDSWLFQQAREALERRQIKASEVLYIGNDMLNDVATAVRTGFRAALFAGDQRSLRWRAGDDRVTGIQPDVVIGHLDEVGECLA